MDAEHKAEHLKNEALEIENKIHDANNTLRLKEEDIAQFKEIELKKIEDYRKKSELERVMANELKTRLTEEMSKLQSLREETDDQNKSIKLQQIAETERLKKLVQK